MNAFRSGAAALYFLSLAGPVWAAGKKPPTERPAAETERDSSSKRRSIKAVAKEKPLAEEAEAHSNVQFVAERPNINDYSLFANGSGWDGNWYVGYNTCWIVLLPPLPAGKFERAYLGAKLGRMKTQAAPGRPSWERQAIPGRVEIAVNAEAVWPQSRRFHLAETSAIPLEGDPENAVDGVGEARWFWVEVPLRLLSRDRNNYIALFSPSENLRDARSAPILAAAWGDTRQNTWLNSSVKGAPPSNAVDSLKTAVTYFDPAVALKLVKEVGAEIEVTLLGPVPKSVTDTFVLSAAVTGRDIASASVECSTDEKKWITVATLWNAPYSFTLKASALPRGAVFLRVAAKDTAENKHASDAVNVFLQPAPVKPAK